MLKVKFMLKLIVFSASAPFLLSCSAVISSGETAPGMTNVGTSGMRTAGNSKPAEVKLTLSTEKRSGIETNL
jgi:hypothetical protein